MRAKLLALVVFSGLSSVARGDELRFAQPLTLHDVTHPVTIAAGDIDGDGKLDLIAASGSGIVEVFRQDPRDRTSWQKSSMTLGLSIYMVRAADLNKDGYAEILLGDPATSAYLIGNHGGVLQKALPIESAKRARWVTAGDWNKDGHLDVATANFDIHSVTILGGDGTGSLNYLGNYGIPEPHAVEPSDLDLDGDLDLFVGFGDMGLRTMEGKGDGTFGAPRLVRGLTPCGRFVFPGDFNEDGRGDVAVTCLRDSPQGVIGNVFAGINLGDGSFKAGLEVVTREIASAAVGDLDGDGHPDLANVSIDSSVLSVHTGNGDGTFDESVPFGPAGLAPSFVIAADLDADGNEDVVVSDSSWSTLTFFWGTGGAEMFESSKLSTGHTGTTPSVSDFDGDGARDFYFPRQGQAGVDLYLRPGLQSRSTPSLKLATQASFSSLAALDLNRDATPDLAGVNIKESSLKVALLGKSGEVLKEQSFPTGSLPGAVQAGRLDGDDSVDLALPCFGSNEIAVFLARGAETLEALPLIPTIESPKLLLLGDIDLDGTLDLALTALGAVAVHHGLGGGAFTPATTVYQSDPPRTFADFALGDVTGDSLPDLLLPAPGTTELLVIPSNGNQKFGAPVGVPLISRARSIFLVDLDADGLLDVTSGQSNHTFSFLRSEGSGRFESILEVEDVRPLAVDHRVEDLNQDGRLDLAVFSLGASAVFEGLPTGAVSQHSFRRGDADTDGKVDLTDAIALLLHLFAGARVPCEDPADADDDGRLSLTDALGIVRWLFQGASPPALPGPESCGDDPTADALLPCESSCL